jgi:hypothetical protein
MAGVTSRSELNAPNAFFIARSYLAAGCLHCLPSGAASGSSTFPQLLDNQVDTGIRLNAQSFAGLPRDATELSFPHCSKAHLLAGVQAWLGDIEPEGDWWSRSVSDGV